ncbi:hypothetical protein EJ03DRAFT_53910 [Teratosphaeria nubilosa]|uniref:DNA-directed RNA polymerase subunit n=1 Tax=Teratosphaeria nubilosa TaxID=161662 RepID=A0A6G1KTQ8_9PEZI|nr:hypothetical protein EJ03DRAFT_53910 [Teratosphaeria nubilosa]
MYTLVTVADVVQIVPSDFNKTSNRAIEDFINTKYADKVIHKTGLCLGFHSFVKSSEGLIGHGTGIVNVNVDFRLVVFRPFKGEIIQGTISHSNASGIFISMEFFEDIVVPPELLFSDTSFETDSEGSDVFIWRADDGAGGVNEFFFDRAEKCLMRVEIEEWNDLSPQMKRPEDFDLDHRDKYGLRLAPYRILCSMMHSGLGPSLWWVGDESGQEGEDGANGTAMEVEQ